MYLKGTSAITAISPPISQTNAPPPPPSLMEINVSEFLFHFSGFGTSHHAFRFFIEQRKQRTAETEVALKEADDLIRKMDLEARSLQPSVKAMLIAKVREYKTDLNNLKSQVKRITTPAISHSAREELLESRETDTLTERINQSSDRIKSSRRTVLETEELGITILQDLHQQRQSLLHASNNSHAVDETITNSKKVLVAMTRRMSRNKWIMGSIVGPAYSILEDITLGLLSCHALFH